ncbi:MAG: aminoglycoside phosphotransferase family protein [Anaerolineales bacterium]|nr:aminoglycoside phosphotransferase family protein [Anaerolineales bacterium]
MNLPPDFISTIRNTYKEAGDRFLANLPALMNEAARRWNLTDIQPASNLSYNFVCYALSSNNRSVVLKIGVPNNELTSEMAALRLFNGEGAVQLIDCDEAKGFLLLERLRPGSMLSTLKDDEEATHIAADVMLKIQRPAPQGDGVFIKLSDWFEGFKRLRKHFDGGTGPFNKTLVEHAERSVQDFFAEDYIPTLMHGDFHHYNILLSERGWAVIDPKGVIGPAGYEVGPFLLNPWEEPLNGSRLALSNVEGFKVRAKKRIYILSERLGMERERIREWGIAHAILSAWWGIEDNTGWEYSMACAEMLCSLRSA